MKEKNFRISRLRTEKEAVPNRLKTVQLFFFDFIFRKSKNFFVETKSKWVFSISFIRQLWL